MNIDLKMASIRYDEVTTELDERTRALEDANNSRQALVLELEAARECNREFLDTIQALTVRAQHAELMAERCHAWFEDLEARVLSLTAQLDATRRTQLGKVTSELDELRARNAELESDLAKAAAHTNDVSGRLMAMTEIAAGSTRDLARSLEREGQVIAREEETNRKLRDALARIAAFTETTR